MKLVELLQPWTITNCEMDAREFNHGFVTYDWRERRDLVAEMVFRMIFLRWNLCAKTENLRVRLA